MMVKPTEYFSSGFHLDKKISQNFDQSVAACYNIIYTILFMRIHTQYFQKLWLTIYHVWTTKTLSEIYII